MLARLQGKVALVTGASGGIGEATVRRLAAEGARLVITDVEHKPCADLTAEVPGDHLPAALDVTDERQWQDVVGKVERDLGRLDVLVNNAGIGSLGTVEDESRDRWDQVIAVDQLGTWLGMKYGGPLIERSGGGSIVNVCSILGTVGGLGNSLAYAAAKGAVRTMTKNAALHWATRGVRVNSLHPGFIETRQLLERFSGTPRHTAMLAGTPMGRLGQAGEVAASVAFLASEDSGFITGSELYVDGGWTAQ
ncbi:short-chain dehydrogenase/reductase SDR [Parafrankia sp. EAN1pec]|uniref:SDR family NAD(P)-dependent oxidoreductase n=1 Tax=Parafrankia sp. (strain EAN1pec) TaxID=298653 RepID=UPI00015D9E97|nr:short-chain dehydrogenase/reductase SDR [Frankia sp. EAN1pec]